MYKIGLFFCFFQKYSWGRRSERDLFPSCFIACRGLQNWFMFFYYYYFVSCISIKCYTWRHMFHIEIFKQIYLFVFCCIYTFGYTSEDSEREHVCIYVINYHKWRQIWVSRNTVFCQTACLSALCNDEEQGTFQTEKCYVWMWLELHLNLVTTWNITDGILTEWDVA